MIMKLTSSIGIFIHGARHYSDKQQYVIQKAILSLWGSIET